MQNITNGNPYAALFDYQAEITPDQVRQARRKLKLVETEYRLKRLEGLTKLVEAATAPEYWTNAAYDRMDRYRTDPWSSSFTNFHDRRHGRNHPVFQNEMELGVFRMQSRILCATNSYAIGLLEGVSAYVLGPGCTYRAISRHEERPAPEELLQAVQDVLDDFTERNQWFGGGQPGVEDEFLWRTCEDGEAFLIGYRDDQGNTEVRFAEPEQITQPLGSPFEEYGFGILTPRDDVQKHLAVNVRWELDGDYEEELPIHRVVHFRRNAKRNIKRGLTDFSFETLDVLHVAGKLNKNMSLGAAIQACYAGVRQHANATKTEVGDLQELLSTYKQTDAATGRTEYYQKHEPGVYDVPEGQQWVNPPTAQNASAHVEILQACLRGAGVRWNAPEWLTSGLHDTSSFASSLTAESPFLRRIQREQRNYTGAFERVMWLAIENKAQSERGLWVGMTVLDADGRDTGQRADRFFRWEEIRRLVEVEGKAPDPTTRDKTQEAQANQIYLQGGIKSPQTVQQELGLDPEQERVNMEEWKELTGGQGMALPMPGDGGAMPELEEPEPDEPVDMDEPAEGELALDDIDLELPTAAEAPDPDEQADAVSGNDLRSTVGGLNAIASLQSQYYAGKIPREAAVANAKLMFGFGDQEAASLFPEIAPQKLTPDDVSAATDKPATESIQEGDDDTVGIKRAKNIADAALKAGRIKKTKCAECGAKEVEMHHTDYRKPLEVTWLCRACHDKAHGKEVPEDVAIEFEADMAECKATKKPGPCKKNKAKPAKKGREKAAAAVPGADGKRKSAAASVAAAAKQQPETPAATTANKSKPAASSDKPAAAAKTSGTPAEHFATAKTIVAAWKSGGAKGMSAKDLHAALAVRHPGISGSQTLAAIQSIAAQSGGKVKITGKNAAGDKITIPHENLTPHIAALRRNENGAAAQPAPKPAAKKAKGKGTIESLEVIECDTTDLPAVPALDLPDRRQDTSYSCGAAALQSVLAHFGKEQDEDTLRQQLGTTFADGTDADRIVEVAKERGLSAAVQQGMGLDGLAQHLQAGHPVIALIQAYGTGHYVVVIGMDGDTVTVQDPNAGRLEMPAEEFAARWVWVDKDNVALRQLGIPIGRGQP